MASKEHVITIFMDVDLKEKLDEMLEFEKCSVSAMGRAAIRLLYDTWKLEKKARAKQKIHFI